MQGGACVLGGRGPRQRIALAINIGQLLSSVPGSQEEENLVI